ncbi:Nucleoside diphosphate kinase [Candidatus Babela massiliensis]|uniref:Nucleoside diphosphate kinase n=1 Tax=Candidatus Babela massiliensis TaxID=673862 RepID=V6DH04_9BACT|nr:nucleoside-diphosphate kinase [Candidatus Babela massiliensis]CDK30877.1 Nucleoside diphosphate kinase [Candidatus Babela massiliensis]
MIKINKILISCLLTLMHFSFNALKLEEKIEVKKPEIQSTLAIIKPDAVNNLNSGDIVRLIELNGFNIKEMKKTTIEKKDAEKFYAVHKERPFFKELVNYMTSGPIIVMVLEKTNAIASWRELMGTTNPDTANMGTIRKMFGQSVQLNAVHGSDSPQAAQEEIKFFFK